MCPFSENDLFDLVQENFPAALFGHGTGLGEGGAGFRRGKERGEPDTDLGGEVVDAEGVRAGEGG